MSQILEHSAQTDALSLQALVELIKSGYYRGGCLGPYKEKRHPRLCS